MNITLGNNLFKDLALFIKDYYEKGAALFILVDENTDKHCMPLLLGGVPLLHQATVIEIPSGEANKNIETCSQIWDELSYHAADRNSLLINLGGGVIGDIGGFAASTYKRGIDYIQIPTTLLAQTDASIGGKTGVDFLGLKNQIGLFTLPKGIFIYPPFLKTLENRELLAGYAEVIKHALVADSNFWKKLIKMDYAEPISWEDIIRTSVKIKQGIVEKDPLEKNERKVLNFGHTIGHALESYSLLYDNTPLLHGETVALGMLYEAYLSTKIAGLPTSAYEEIKTLIKELFLPYPINGNAYPSLLEYMYQDKKNQDGSINFTLLKNIGKPIINQTCSEELILEALRTQQSFSK